MPLFVIAHLVLALLLDELVPEEEQFAKVAQCRAQRLVKHGLVVIAHGILGYHGRVRSVGLQTAHHRAVPDALGVLQPHVIPLAVKELAEPPAVVAGVLSTEESRILFMALGVSACPLQKGAVACRGRLELTECACAAFLYS